MNHINCPHCKQPTFNWWDKYLAAKWKMLSCSQCKRRICSMPLLLAAFYTLYVWDLMFFGLVAYLKHSVMYVGIMLVFWLILDYFSVYLPLVALRGKTSTDQSTHNQTNTDPQAKSVTSPLSPHAPSFD